ncbi:transcriptional regulator [uncultured Alistipes sp.]|uniref:transcriptional regulator n=1 Tax=uncultured Alistipes sp. TaxID=538949 RepID=UPI002634CAF7|nr:transcriptional regulator [uncultured Alistipes sp.]
MDTSEESVEDLSPVLAERFESRRNSLTVRWYVLTLPLCHRGPAVGLQRELDRRIRNGEPAFEYFAPSYVEVKNEDGHFVNTRRPLLYNYVFVRSSESEICRMKRELPQYNFLPRVRTGLYGYYPYLSDEAMRNLRWIARSYSDELPVYAPETDRLTKGDRVRITEGRFKGVEARVVIRPGAGRKDVVVCVENWMWVPLLHVRPGEYEIIALHESGKHVYTRLDNDRLLSKLHEAIGRCLSAEGATDEDRTQAAETIKQYGKLQMDSDVLRCKLYTMLLLAHTVLGTDAERGELIGTIRNLLPLVKAEQARAGLLVALYGCTDSSLYHDRAHEIVDRWKKEKSPKKSKQRLIRWLDDYDRWLGH